MPCPQTRAQVDLPVYKTPHSIRAFNVLTSTADLLCTLQSETSDAGHFTVASGLLQTCLVNF